MTDKTLVEWRPEWTPDEEAAVQAAVEELRGRISALRALREMLGLSQVDLSRILETTQSNISKMEAKADPRLSEIRKIIEHRGGRLRVIAEVGGKVLELPI